MSEKRLAELAEVIYGSSPTGYRAITSNIPMYGSGGIVGYATKPLFELPSVVVPRKGSLGTPWYSAKPFWAIDTTYVATPKMRVDAKWLFYHLLNFDLTKLNEATGVPSISRDWLLKQRFYTPDYEEQKGIAEVLSVLDDQIAATEALISKKVLVRSAILTALVNDTHASSVAIDVLASKVGSGVTPTGGSEVYTSSGVTFVRSQNVLNERLELSDVAFITNETHACMAASKLQAHDVLLNITGASIGRSCIFPEGIGEANVNQHVCIIRLHNPCQADAALMAALICSEFGQRELNRQISGGNREGLNYQQVRAMSIPWPQDAAIRAEMAAVLEAAKSEIEELEAVVMKLQQQKKGLMHDLLTGKTKVLP